MGFFNRSKKETSKEYIPPPPPPKKCHHKFVPNYKEALISMHMSTTRYLKCPKCNKRSWTKKVMNKE